MPSHAPLCGINRPHVRHWSRTNRIDSILELPPVTPDTGTVPPPTRSPEPKVTRYIVIRNDQHDGSSHHGKIFIVAGDRLASARPLEKHQLRYVTFRRPAPSATARAPASRSRRADFHPPADRSRRADFHPPTCAPPRIRSVRAHGYVRAHGPSGRADPSRRVGPSRPSGPPQPIRHHRGGASTGRNVPPSTCGRPAGTSDSRVAAGSTKSGYLPSHKQVSTHQTLMIAKNFFTTKDIRRIGTKILRDHGPRSDLYLSGVSVHCGRNGS
jgi:hypothetical protein